jgi:hypothetical protein
MSVKILIPASEIVGLNKSPLVLEVADRCSRCDRTPAKFYEVHHLFCRVKHKPNRMFGKKYDLSKEYKLKIKICESCYQTDYLTHPDALDRNNSALGRIAKFHSVAWTLGALLAAFGFLLLTPLIPETGILQPLKSIWRIPVAVSVVVLFLTWLSQRKYQNQTLRALEKSDPGYQAHLRAEALTPILEDMNDLSSPSLVIKMENESWAVEAATKHGWTYQNIDAITGTTPNLEE